MGDREGADREWTTRLLILGEPWRALGVVKVEIGSRQRRLETRRDKTFRRVATRTTSGGKARERTDAQREAKGAGNE